MGRSKRTQGRSTRTQQNGKAKDLAWKAEKENNVQGIEKSNADPQDTSASLPKHSLCSMVEKIVANHKCPITMALPIDPVLAEDGHIYDRDALKLWVTENGVSPVTKQKISSNVTPALSVRQTIEELLDAGAVDDDAASDFFWGRALQRVAKDVRGAKADLERAFSLGKQPAQTDFVFKVIAFRELAETLGKEAASRPEEFSRVMSEMSNGLPSIIRGSLNNVLSEFRELPNGTPVKLLDNPRELQRLCERPAPGAREAVHWVSCMKSWAGKMGVIEKMGDPDHLSYRVCLEEDSYASRVFPYDALSLVP
eukprot:TRINITY_DN156_c0_g1_i1.p1 TRINITY_DN156_c0_g1~~TRINITY_DN156_c0_g1_i1.p1  ORF type:complete len:310 (-),score=49.05 TRINITY_DN156_c0_g1_i1:54-983(-)